MANFDSTGKSVNQSRGELSSCSYLSETYDLLEAPMQPLDKKQQTRLWQQNQYLTDSGIHSALTTHTPSITSKANLDENEPEESILSQASGPYVQAWSSSGPMSVYPSESCLLSPGTPSASSIIGMDPNSEMSSMTCSRSDATMDPRGNKISDLDTDEAENAIPELVRLIKDEDDKFVIYQASTMVFHLSKSEAIDALIQSKEMISCILSALDPTGDPETVRLLAGTLYNMSQTQTGLKEIFLANCVPCLVGLLNSPVESVLFYAITTLHNLLLHQEGAKAVVRQSGCLQKLTSLLQKNNIKFLTICTDCLQILAYSHQESKLQILAGGGPIELIRILNTYQYEKLLWTTARVLKVLSVCTSNKPVIIEVGGMEALAKHLNNTSSRLVLNCLWTLRNLSDAATKLNDLQPILTTVVQLLASNDLNIVTCAAGILSNLTCNNSANKLIVYRRGGLRGLLHALGHSHAKEEILEPSMCALRHLTSRHDEEEKARSEFVTQLGGHIPVAHVLHAATAGVCPELCLVCQPPHTPLTSWTLVKAVVGLLRNLSMNVDNHRPMLETGIVAGLSVLLYATQYEIAKRKATAAQRNGNGSGPNAASQTMVHNVRLEEIVEGICVAMHMLSREPGTRLHLSRFRAPTLSCPGFSSGGPCTPGLNIFVHLLCTSTNESVHRAALGVLVEVAQDRDTFDAIASVPGISNRLNELASSRNEAISTYASTLILRLTSPSPPPNSNQGPQSNIDDSSLVVGSGKMVVDTLNTPPPPPLPMDTSCGGRMSPVTATSTCFSPPQPMYHQHHGQSMVYGGLQQQQQQGPPPQRYAPPPPGNYHYSSNEPVGGSGNGCSSLMAMVGPPPNSSTYSGGSSNGCPMNVQQQIPQQQQHPPHCYQQQNMNEGAYQQCTWGNPSYPQEPQGRSMYANQMPPHHAASAQQPQSQEGMYAPPGMGYIQPSGNMRGVQPAYHHRGSSAAAQGGYYGSGHMDTQHGPPSQGGPMTSPNPRGCYSSSMDTTNSTSGYASPGTASKMAMADDYMNPVMETTMKPSVNPSTPNSTSTGGNQPDHRWFSSAQMCLP
ncbi:unnamed protein product [Rodentolepis nana]|uniref:Armadillo segment polarity protein n=1 Tax=Rodentolepis nana TaxID=102285 RepID=A0A158QGX9_RODNA|nr:unnamed protein product [Rodentolepis nana]